MITQENIDEVVKRIVEGYHPEKIILFGSYANGTATEYSDLDLLIIKETYDAPHQRDAEVYMMLKGIKVAVDIRVYNNEELNKRANKPLTFENEVITTGKIIYHAA